jgi:steroid delta-isomerase-like uncharacterized protein
LGRSGAVSGRAGGSPIDENEAIARRFITAVLDGQDVAAADELVSADHVHHRADGSEQRGRAARLASARAWHAAFPDYHHDIEDLVTSGDRVVVRYTATGTQQGAYREHPPTGQRAQWKGVFIYRIAAGRIAETWAAADLLGQLRQIGAIAPHQVTAS